MSTQETFSNRKQRPKPQLRLIRSATYSRLNHTDLEFSEYARSPRFLPGWWIAPGVVLGIASIIWIASLIA